MKKSFVALLLAAVLVMPVFASGQGTKEIALKVGTHFNPTINFGGDGDGSNYKVNSTFVAGAEFYYFVKDNLGVGIGFSNVFNTTPKIPIDTFVDGGFTNFYLGVKPKVSVKDGVIDNMYLLANVGYSLVRAKIDGESADPENGLYWAIGIGAEKGSFLFELAYSVNYSKFGRFEYLGNLVYTTIGANIGYKFAI